jgi:hypothetical protein
MGLNVFANGVFVWMLKFGSIEVQSILGLVREIDNFENIKACLYTIICLRSALL